ncbi:diguanylate cyclase (GGDEF)-like protein [Deinococcus metalli]|uniref:Diguanylate cyclase n=1 Tax=Deinococcus metalli TaxID=1141878 RepID=A0A7W8KCX3_9DEIO|nr:diguanylate cyclase [Deinococcus metalli]MBB5375882.1 diguanylate cyclase (GGDEF)-like protein [Deinococcus metalli]GHF36332.1 diguanylate cyclase [Deinococcus metalli]
MVIGEGSGHEVQRLVALARYDVLDTAPEERFDRLTALVADVLDVPVALVNFVDHARHWSKSCVGVPGGEVPRAYSFCAHTIELAAIGHDGGLVVPDLRADERFADNPLVVGGPGAVLYAGVPLTTADGYHIGTLCVLDFVARPFGERELRLLRGFAALVMDALDARQRERQLTLDTEASAAQLRELRRVAADAETLAAITALFDSGLDPVEATLATAELVSSAASVDWCGLFRAQDGQLDLLAAWDRQPRDLLGSLDPQAITGSVTGFAARSQLSAFVDDYSAHPRAVPELLNLGVTSVAALALGEIDGGRYLLASARLDEVRPWRRSDRALLEAAARSVRGALERHAQLRSAQAAAALDALTGLPNRRALDEALRRQDSAGLDFTVALVDLDGMKAVNDEEGHDRGDTLLQVFAQALRAQFRSSDGVYRLGGDEFAILLRDPPDGLSADEVLERVDQAVVATRAASFSHIGASTGVTRANGRSALDAVAEADRMMYEHKRRKASLRQARAVQPSGR